MVGVTAENASNNIIADTWAPHILVDAENTLVEGNIVFTSVEGAAANGGQDLRKDGILFGCEQTDSLGEYADSHGIKGTRILNNLIVYVENGINGWQGALNSSYQYSDILIANNSIIEYGGNSGAGIQFINAQGAPYGTNVYIVNNLLASQKRSYFNNIGGPVVGPIYWRNNLYLFDSTTQNVWTNTGYSFAQISTWFEKSGETNSGPYSGTWRSSTNSASTIISDLFSSATSMPQLWGASPDINVDTLFADLSTSSNTVVSLRQQIVSPFTPIKDASNPAYITGTAFRTWTYTTDHSVTYSDSSAVTSDIFGYSRPITPTLGAIEPWRSTARSTGLRLGTLKGR